MNKAVKVNLSTKPKEIVDTIREERQKAEYFFKKEYGGRAKYEKMEGEMIDKTLAEEQDQYTDFSYWISPVGNRWMSYTHVEYFPKAKFAQAFIYSFIYYETYASCGAFFPLYSPKQMKKGKLKKNAKPDSAIIYTDHFFHRMSERTKIEYRSKELIRKFISERCEHALSIMDADATTKFKGGHGFGKETSMEPQVIEIRTFLTDEELNTGQRKRCEVVDAMYELTRDGMYIPEVEANTMVLKNYKSKETIEEMGRRWKAIEKLGLQDVMFLASATAQGYALMVEKLLKVNVNENQIAAISYSCNDILQKIALKYAGKDCSTYEMNKVFEQDLIDTYVKCSKRLKLKPLTRERIEEYIQDLTKNLVFEK